MNIFKVFVDWIKRKNTKALPEVTGYSIDDERREFLEKMQVSEEQQVEEVVNNRYLENSLQLFFNSYQELLDENQNIIIPNSYNALARINALGGNSNINAMHEQELMEYIYSSGRYTFQTQTRAQDGAELFYHIKTQGYNLPSDDKIIRIYLNCRNENTAELAKNLIECNGDSQFYLKVDTTQSLKIASRAEKIVIYTTDEQFDYCIQLINHVKTYRPDLFQDSEKVNPFLESSEGIAYTRQPTSNTFYRLDGLVEPIAQSSNSYIAQIIKNSYMEAAREVAAVDQDLQFLLDSQNYNDEILYMQNYPYIDSKYHAFLINSMEQKMRYLCMQNGIVIKGINDTRQVETEQGVAPEQ